MANMTLLEYLAPSRTRRELLKALWPQKEGVSVRELAKRTGVAYSNAHRELARMKLAGLLRRAKSGKALLCSWNSHSAAGKVMARVLEAPQAGSTAFPDEDAVFWNLKRWGAPLTRAGKPGPKLRLEETLAYAVDLAQTHPDVARVWPVVLARHRDRLDLEAFVQQARRLGRKRALGFFLALTAGFLKDPSLRDAGRRLRDRRFRKTVDFFRVGRGRRARELAERRTPRLARAWGFRMNMPLESFRSTFDKFAGQHAVVRR